MGEYLGGLSRSCLCLLQGDLSGAHMEPDGSRTAATDCLAVDGDVSPLKNAASRGSVFAPNVEEVAANIQLGSADDYHTEPLLGSAKSVGSLEEDGNAGVGKDGWIGFCLRQVETRIREQNMKQAANFGQLVVNDDANAGTERVGDKNVVR